jgi:hypothetical protein
MRISDKAFVIVALIFGIIAAVVAIATVATNFIYKNWSVNTAWAPILSAICGIILIVWSINKLVH